MAKINTSAYRKLKIGQFATVGHNRRVHVYPDRLICTLHGHPILTAVPFNGYAHIVLDTCGYSTTTTRSAMKDFLQLLLTGYAGVSFAKGGFDASAAGVQFSPMVSPTKMAADFDSYLVNPGPLRNLIQMASIAA